MNDRMTSDNNAASRYFTSICYSAGMCKLEGQDKHISMSHILTVLCRRLMRLGRWKLKVCLYLRSFATNATQEVPSDVQPEP